MLPSLHNKKCHSVTNSERPSNISQVSLSQGSGINKDTILDTKASKAPYGLQTSSMALVFKRKLSGGIWALTSDKHLTNICPTSLIRGQELVEMVQR